ncbi:MAG: helix-hairpin-helix domain-containing protein [Gammaproteobacteria bacterium]|nr:helix-hairpin-helix domain-containing protein [Gammaproteobacteria bacterium]
MTKKAVFALLLSGLPFIANMALAVENQITEFSDSAVVTSEQTPINLNTATAEQLMTLKGVGKKKAQAIITYREQHNGFQRIEELDEVKGIGPKLLSINLVRLTVSSNQQQTDPSSAMAIPLNRSPLLTPE